MSIQAINGFQAKMPALGIVPKGLLWSSENPFLRNEKKIVPKGLLWSSEKPGRRQRP